MHAHTSQPTMREVHVNKFESRIGQGGLIASLQVTVLANFAANNSITSNNLTHHAPTLFHQPTLPRTSPALPTHAHRHTFTHLSTHMPRKSLNFSPLRLTCSTGAKTNRNCMKQQIRRRPRRTPKATGSRNRDDRSGVRSEWRKAPTRSLCGSSTQRCLRMTSLPAISQPLHSSAPNGRQCLQTSQSDPR